MTTPAPLVFVIRVRTQNVLNARVSNSRAAGIIQRKRDAHERDAAKSATEAAMRRDGLAAHELVPAKVLITRASAGRLDPHDGLPAACKRVVDGIALALGIDDGGPFVTWAYQQAKVKPGIGFVHVRIERQS